MRNVILLFLLIVGWTTTVYAQNEQETIEVTGIVTDPKNEPLIGVNVTARNMPGFGAGKVLWMSVCCRNRYLSA